jgi:Fe-Mn family superoxide dismutase
MYTLPVLPYAYNALEPFIDEQTMHIHHEKHHAAYIKNLNDALVGHDDLSALSVAELVANLARVPEDIRVKVRNNAGGHLNHSLFWTLMAANGAGGGGEPTGKLLEAINAAFGSFSAFQEKFAAQALARFGSGWVWVISDGGKLAIVDTPNQDTPVMDGKKVILGLDVWEHAYYLRYQNVRAEYVKQWWNVVNWSAVDALFATAYS